MNEDEVENRCEIDEELYQPALSYSTFERVTASIGELVEGIRKGDIKIDADKLRSQDIGLKPEDLVAELYIKTFDLMQSKIKADKVYC